MILIVLVGVLALVAIGLAGYALTAGDDADELRRAGETSRVQGRVTVDGEPVVGEAVEMSSAEDVTDRATHYADMTTDDNGRFVFSEVTPDRYTLAWASPPLTRANPRLRADGSATH